MKYLLLCLLPLFVGIARAQERAPVLAKDEIALEGRIVGVDGIKNEVQLNATAFVGANGRSQTFATAKPKTLQLLPGTQLQDERTGKAGTLGDLKIGLLVRAMGRDGGSGKPLALRVLSWSSAEAPDPDTPTALLPLLPPAATWRGTSLRLVDAGFKTLAQNASDSGSPPQWTMAWRAKPEGAVRLLGIWTPGETITNSTGQVARVLSDGTRVAAPLFSGVDPRWKSVRARFEMKAANAPADASGEFRSETDVDIPVPPDRDGVLTPLTQWKTPHGGIVELAGVEAKDNVGRLKITLRWKPPTSTPDARIECSLWSFRGGDEPLRGVSSSNNSYEEQRMAIQELSVLPRSAPLRATLTIKESSPSWRQNEFFHVQEFDLPVSQIVAALPPPRHENAPPALEVDTPHVVASLEGPRTYNPQSATPSYSLGLWLAAQGGGETAARSGVEQRVLLRSIRYRFPSGQENERTFSSSEGDILWHSDRSPAKVGENGWSLYFDTKEKGNVQVTGTAQLASVFEGDHHFENIPIPAFGATRELGEDWGDDVVNVRKIAWIGPDRWKDNDLVRQNIYYNIGPRGALVVVCDLLHIWNGSQMHTSGLNFSDDVGTPYMESSDSSWNGDVLDKGTLTPTTVSFVMAPPATGAKMVSFSLHLSEVSAGQSQTFTFPAVALNSETP